MNHLPVLHIYWPELLFGCPKAGVPFFSPITLLSRNYLYVLQSGWFKVCKLVLCLRGLVSQIKSLFTCLVPLGGWRNNNNGKFNNQGNSANFWSSSPNNNTNAWKLNMNSNNKKANMNNNNRSSGFSVRCLQH